MAERSLLWAVQPPRSRPVAREKAPQRKALLQAALLQVA